MRTLNRSQGWSVAVFLSYLMWALIITMLVGCEESQLERIDKIVSDANDMVSTGQGVLQSPAGAHLPPDIRLYGTIGLALASIGINGWQKVRGTLMKKTTKAIVQGIEDSEREQNPKPKISTVKDAIGNRMTKAGIYDQGNKIVDQLKIAR